MKRNTAGVREKFPAGRSADEFALAESGLGLNQQMPPQLPALTVTEEIPESRLARRSLQKRVSRQTAQIENLLAEMEAFSYTLAHDMRAPLRTMHGYAELLLERHGDRIDGEIRDFIQRIKAGSERLDTLVQDVLKYSRISRTEVDLQPVQLERLVREMIAEYPLFRPPNAEIEINAPLLPVRGHEGFLTQCISNILNNAIKFVPPGTQPHISISTKAVGSSVQLSFADNGIGIAPKDHRRIFGIFQRVHGPRHFEGTGIGLAIVHRAAERMGGQVGVKSTPGKGSRFWLQLPRA